MEQDILKLGKDKEIKDWKGQGNKRKRKDKEIKEKAVQGNKRKSGKKLRIYTSRFRKNPGGLRLINRRS